jgi:hypothetical protein
MASKGYTLNYFIEFFRSIPDHQWTTGVEQHNTVQHCAIGHALRDRRTNLSNTSRPANTRLDALNNFLGTDAWRVNDGTETGYASLGKTPRGRMLCALRNRKRYGNVLGRKA